MRKAPKDAKWGDPVTMFDSLIYRFDKSGYLKPGNYHLFVVPVEGGTARQVTQGDFDHGYSELLPGAAAPEWSPDGRNIFMVANRRTDHEYELLDTEIHENDLKDDNANQVTDRREPHK